MTWTLPGALFRILFWDWPQAAAVVTVEAVIRAGAQ